ncbi:MAG: carboxymuconolactone decarboxylase family protein [Anaerolineae bacterium]|nr:carboxymuconolactone decarboxylase family protein [Anaerolineae bacterium]
MKKRFNKRTYHGIKDLITDMRLMMSSRERIRAMMHSDLVNDAFRERLMLAVTSVNGCRYCSYFHARQALSSGIRPEEIAEMTALDFGSCPAEEQAAVLYAQHWAEMDAQPDPAVRENVLALYGAEKLDAIEIALRMIRMGNLMGNSFDKVLFRLSFGLLGG